MDHERCPEIIAHAELLGGLKADVAYIRLKIDNGLSDKLTKVEKTLDEARRAIDDRIDKLDSENWFNRILTGSIKKIIGLIIVIAVLSGLTSTFMWANYKYYAFKEIPGQQLATYELQKAHTYHSHILTDGTIVFHADDVNQPAWILNTTTNIWERRPQLRTDDGLNIKIEVK